MSKYSFQKFESLHKYRKLEFRTSGIYSDPPFGRPIPVWMPTELPINHLWWLDVGTCGAVFRLEGM